MTYPPQQWVAPPPVSPPDEVPGPPPGPGVRAPFAAPPTERDSRRMWIGLGIGLAVLVVCCGGGVFGFGALVYSQSKVQVPPQEAVSTVDEYLRDLRNNDYSAAYGLLCDDDRNRESMASFQNRQNQQSPIKDYSIGRPREAFPTVDVPVLIVRFSGPENRDFTVVEQRAGAARICGGE